MPAIDTYFTSETVYDVDYIVQSVKKDKWLLMNRENDDAYFELYNNGYIAKFERVSDTQYKCIVFLKWVSIGGA